MTYETYPSLSMQLVPRMGQEFHMQRLSRETPVLDSISSIQETYPEIKRQLLLGKDVDVFLLGGPGWGKSALSEQLQVKLCKEKDIQTSPPTRRGRKQATYVPTRYYSFSMGVEEAKKIPGLVERAASPYSPTDYQHISSHMRRRLNTAEGQHTPPFLRVIELPGVEAHTDTGRSIMPYVGERLRRDSLYAPFVFGSIAQRQLIERNITMREEIWTAQTAEELAHVFAKYHIKSDEEQIHPLEMKKRMGPATSIKRADEDVKEQILLRQGEIRVHKIDQSLPMVESKEELSDESLWERAMSDLYFLLAMDWELPQERMIIAINRLLPRRQIPYYGRRIRSNPDVCLAPSLESSPSAAPVS